MPRVRTVRIQVRLSEREADALNENVAKSGLTREGYIRHLINGYIPHESPPADYFSMMEQLYQVGINLNQIAKKAHVLNVIDVQKYDEAMQSYNQIIRDITQSMILPRKVE